MLYNDAGFFFLLQNKSQIDRIDGAKAADLTKKVKLLCSGQTQVPLPAEDKKPTQVKLEVLAQKPRTGLRCRNKCTSLCTCKSTSAVISGCLGWRLISITQ